MDEFYNQAQKAEFIESDKTNAITLRNYFRRLKSKEEEHDKDISMMDLNELLDSMQSLNIMRESTRAHLISMLRKYVIWLRLIKKTDVSPSLEQITPESIGCKAAVVNRMLSGPDQLQRILDSNLRLIAQPNRDIRDRLVAWLLYLGLQIFELQALRKNSMARDGTIMTSQGVYIADDKIISLWRKYSEVTYLEKVGLHTRKGAIHSLLMDSDLLFRPVAGQKGDNSDTQPKRGTFIELLLSIFKNSTADEILVSPLNLRASGLFHQIYTLERSGVPFKAELIAYKFGVDYSDSVELYSRTRKLRTDYKDWKAAFGYK